MHDPGDECDCSECRVRAIWPAEQVTREDRPTSPHIQSSQNLEQIWRAIADLRVRMDRIDRKANP